MGFDDEAKQVVRDFVRSVLLIDDDWPDRGNPETVEVVAAPASVFVDPAAADDSLSDGSSAGATEGLPPRTEHADSLRLLQIEKVVLKSGALFSGFRYGSSSNGNPAELQRLACRLAQRADVVILDWHLVGTSFAEALSIVEHLYNDKGLHFICVYTGQEQVSEVRESIIGKLGQAPVGDERDFRINHLNFAIRNKTSPPHGGDGDVVEAENLFETAVKSIAQTYSSFVQLGLLELTTRHRDHLPRMLGGFASDIDAAFLFEATNHESPVGTRGTFLTLMLDEWRALLESSLDDRPMKIMSNEGLAQFIEQHKSIEFEQVKKHLACVFGNEHKAVIACTNTIEHAFPVWIASGLKDAPPHPSKGQNWTKDDMDSAKWAFTRATINPLLDTNEGKGFAPLLKLDALFHQQTDPPKRIIQGSVLRVKDGLYLICITPACDAERAEKIRHIFSFLVGKKVSIGCKPKAHEGLGIVILDEGDPIALNIQKKPVITLRIPVTSLSPQRTVHAYHPDIALLTADQKEKKESNVAGDISNEGDKKDSKPYELTSVAQLRIDHALALVAEASAEASRVGLNRGEFIRNRFKSKQE